MASKISVINFAFTLLGINPITSLEEESVTASTAKLVYEISLDSLVAMHAWTFAIVRKNLDISHDTAPAWGYTDAFNLPEDCLRILQVGEFELLPNIDYKVENRQILTNESSVSILYVSNDFNIQHAAPGFIETLAAKIAVNLCGKLADISSKLNAMAAIYSNNLRLALQENDSASFYVEENSSWLRSRYNYGYAAIPFAK